MTYELEYDHDIIFCPSTSRLGEIHWYLLKAATSMGSVVRSPVKVDSPLGAGFVRYEPTEFGKEVGGDEINWWVFKKEKNLVELRERTQRALDAAQVLKQGAEALKEYSPKSYPILLRALKGFAENRTTEIGTALEYVRWLSARDILAPNILFTYRVWGSTRRGDRWIDVDAKTPAEESPDKLRQFTEMVLGLRSVTLYALDKAHYDVGADIAERMEADGAAGDAKVIIPVGPVVLRASRRIFDECATYFTCIRDSLRNILLDIDKFNEHRDLLSSDAFWRAVVSKAVQTQKTETQLWDFKETLTVWHVEKKPERTRAKVAFAEDVASLANARGGVLIVGVTDRREIVGIGEKREAEARLKIASDAVARHLEYGSDIARLQQVVVPDGKGAERLCLLVIVSQACEAVGVHHGEGHYTYPVRRETGIERISREEIASRKVHIKSDNHDFLHDLSQFVHDD